MTPPPKGRAPCNVVFDLGGVVFYWNPDAMCREVFPDPAVRARVVRALFGNTAWQDYDVDRLSRADAVTVFADLAGVPPARIDRLLDVHKEWLTPVPETVALVEELAAAGHRLFVLSNVNRASLAHLEAKFDFWRHFEGVVTSGHEGILKPDPAIFRILLDRYALAPADTLFLDDGAANLVAALRFGIHAIPCPTPEAGVRAVRHWL